MEHSGILETFLSTCSVIYPENMHVWRERRSSHFLAWRVNHTWMTVPITAVGLVCVCVCYFGTVWICVCEFSIVPCGSSSPIIIKRDDDFIHQLHESRACPCASCRCPPAKTAVRCQSRLAPLPRDATPAGAWCVSDSLAVLRRNRKKEG